MDCLGWHHDGPCWHNRDDGDCNSIPQPYNLPRLYEINSSHNWQPTPQHQSYYLDVQLAAGSHSITAYYPGNNDGLGDIWLGSTSAAYVLTITGLTPTVTVTPSASSITTTQALSVSVVVNGGSGNPVPTGSVILTSGVFTSASTTLSAGGATISIPAGALAPGNDTLTVTYTPDTSSPSGYTGAVGSGSVTVLSGTVPASSNFGSVNVASSSTALVQVLLPHGGTLGSISVLTQGTTGLDFVNASGGTCTTGLTYAANVICTVNVSFTPKYAGVRYGAVVLKDASNNVLGMEYVDGIGSGPQVTFNPGKRSVVGSGFRYPTGVALDGNANLFVADQQNNAVKEIVAAGGYNTINTIGGGFYNPFGVAIDGAGNIFVADTWNNAVKEVVAASGYTTINTLGTGFNRPTGVAVDVAGNVFVADQQNNAVKEILATGGYTTVNTLGSGFNYPTGLSLDGSGNVFVADAQNNAVKEIVAAGGYTTIKTLSSAFSYPEGVAVDASGDVYVTDNGNLAVKEIVAAGGYATVNTLASAFNQPVGLALDGSGNVYVVSQGDTTMAKLDLIDAPSLAFATTSAGSISSDSPQIVTLANIGNSTLSIPILSTGSNPSISVNFALNSSGSNACPLVSASSSAAGSLAAGASCLLPISFGPVSAGALSGSLLVTDNSLNVSNATQSISLSGIARQTSQAITFASPASPLTYGISPITLNASASSGLSVTFSVVSGPGTISGNALTFTGLGTIVIAANQAGNASYTAAPQVTQSIIVTQASQTINFATPTSPVTYGVLPITLSATGGASGNAVVFSVVSGPGTISGSTLTVTGAGTIQIAANQAGNANYTAAPQATQSLVANKATPVVTWANPAPIVYGAALSATQLNATASVPGNFVYTPASGTVLAAGTQALNVTFTPSDTADYATVAATATLIVNVPPSFTISGIAVSAIPGATTGNTSTITVTPAGGFNGSVALTASVTSSPNGAQYPPTLSFGSSSPVNITGSAAGTATLTIYTTAASVGALTYPLRQEGRWYSTGGAVLACTLLFGLPARRRRWQTVLGMLALLVALTGSVLGCGSGGGGGGGISNPGTSAGVYTVTVTGASGTTTAMGTVTLNVQ